MNVNEIGNGNVDENVLLLFRVRKEVLFVLIYSRVREPAAKEIRRLHWRLEV